MVRGRMFPLVQETHGHADRRWIGRTYPIRVAYVEHGKPDVPPGMAGDPQGKLRVQRVEESGESERCPVIGQIGIASRDNIISRESGQTSVWSFVTR